MQLPHHQSSRAALPARYADLSKHNPDRPCRTAGHASLSKVILKIVQDALVGTSDGTGGCSVPAPNPMIMHMKVRRQMRSFLMYRVMSGMASQRLVKQPAACASELVHQNSSFEEHLSAYESKQWQDPGLHPCRLLWKLLKTWQRWQTRRS